MSVFFPFSHLSEKFGVNAVFETGTRVQFIEYISSELFRLHLYLYVTYFAPSSSVNVVPSTVPPLQSYALSTSNPQRAVSWERSIVLSSFFSTKISCTSRFMLFIMPSNLSLEQSVSDNSIAPNLFLCRSRIPFIRPSYKSSPSPVKPAKLIFVNRLPSRSNDFSDCLFTPLKSISVNLACLHHSLSKTGFSPRTNEVRLSVSLLQDIIMLLSILLLLKSSDESELKPISSSSSCVFALKSRDVSFSSLKGNPPERL